MPALVTADNSRIVVRKRRETTSDRSLWGTWDPGALRTLNLSTENFKGAIEHKRSTIGTATRHPGPSRLVSVSGAGQIMTDVVFGPCMHEAFEDGMFSLFSTPLSIVSSAIEFVAADNALVDSGASGVLFTNIVEQTWIEISGHEDQDWADNWAWVLDKPNANTVILAFQDVVDEAEGNPITIKGSYVRDGNNFISNTFEREHTDFTTERFWVYPGQVSNGFELKLTFEEMAKLTQNFTGLGALAPSDASISLVSAIAAEDVSAGIMDVSNNMRAFRTSGALDGNVRDFTVNLQQNNEYIKLAQQLQPGGISLGTMGLSGQLDGYMVDNAGRNTRAFSNTYENFHLRLTNPLGTYFFTLFKARYKDQGDKGKTAASGPVMQEMPFECDFDSTVNAWIQVCKFPVA